MLETSGAGPPQLLPSPPAPPALHLCLHLSSSFGEGDLLLCAQDATWPLCHWTHSKPKKAQIGPGRGQRSSWEEGGTVKTEVWNQSDHPRVPPASLGTYLSFHIWEVEWGTPRHL